MAMEFKSFIPVNEILKRHIAYFYFDMAPDIDFHKEYSFFPHVNTTLTFYNKAAFSVRKDIYHIDHCGENSLLKLLTRQHQIKTVVQKGPLDKIGIVFHPLGLNHFIIEPYYSLAKEEVQYFTPVNNEQWNESISRCFNTADIDKRIQILEESLLSLLHTSKNYKSLYAVIGLLSNVEGSMSIQDIAAQNHINLRKLNRDFKRELAISPEMFRMISRFRYVVDQKILQNANKKLTVLTYEGGYFDQSYMIRTFKKLTGLTPLAFFKQVQQLGASGTFWKIHDTKNVV